ncbi:cyclic nucleotide-binding domain-containing protein [Pseudomonadota bacterium]
MNGTTDNINQSLQRSSLAEGLTEEQCLNLAKIIETRELTDREALITEGQTDNCLYVIVEGRLEVTRDVSGGEWLTLAVLKEGDFAGEMGFIDGTKHSATLRAMGETQVLTLSRDALESLIDTDPHAVYKLMQNIVRTVHKILMRMNQQYVEMNNYISKQHGRY